jgi:Lar family restriction alleviation protein
MNLKPCPFCGGKPKYQIVDSTEDTPNAGGEYIECTKCGASTNLTFPAMDDVKKIVIEKWNRRVKP